MYAIALSELSKDVVHKYVGQEPSGFQYNELVLDLNGSNYHTLLSMPLYRVDKFIDLQIFLWSVFVFFVPLQTKFFSLVL